MFLTAKRSIVIWLYKRRWWIGKCAINLSKCLVVKLRQNGVTAQFRLK